MDRKLKLLRRYRFINKTSVPIVREAI